MTTADVQQRVLWLVANELAPPDICDLFNISHRSLQHWNEHPKQLPPFPLNLAIARPPILNRDRTHDLYTLLTETPQKFLDEVQDWLSIWHNLRIPKNILFRHIHGAALSYNFLQTTANERDDDVREAWMDDINAHFSARQLVFFFIDFTSKDERVFYHHSGPAAPGNEKLYHTIAALSLDGYEALHVVPRPVDGSELFDFVAGELLPRMNPYPQDKSIIVLENGILDRLGAKTTIRSRNVSPMLEDGSDIIGETFNNSTILESNCLK